MRLLLILLLTFNLLNAKKIALLIGNSDYPFAPLKNPLHDVDAIYKTLKEIKFDDIKVLKNASKVEIERALANFSQRAQSAEIALIYFSGHGMQVNNTNYMLPARTNPKKPVDLFGLVNLDYFIQSATSAKYGIVLVDACRDNPLVKYFQNGRHKGLSAKKGLGQVTPTTGQMVIGFATTAGETADDGNGNMSPYAEALSRRLKEPNKDITKVLGLVALDVSSKHNQNPILRTNLAYDVYLNRIEENRVNRNGRDNNHDMSNIVVIDGLMYQNQPFTKEYTWKEAKEYCQNLTLGGYSDWRLPTRAELMKLGNIKLYNLDNNDNWKKWFNKNKHRRYKNSKNHYYFIKKEFIENMPEFSWFWTSTEEDSSIAWLVYFKSGVDGWDYKTGEHYALCVRGQ